MIFIKLQNYVHVILYPDHEPLEIPNEMMLCLKVEPTAESFFYSLTESEQHHNIKWIYSAKTENTKEERLAQAINRLMKGLKY